MHKDTLLALMPFASAIVSNCVFIIPGDKCRCCQTERHLGS